MPHPALIVHGGAGQIPANEHNDYINGCKLAAQAAWKLLESGASALQTVEAAVRILEDNPTFDSGRGSFLNRDGQIEMDAIIVDGATLNLGAVIALQGVANPITLARLVMTESPHSVLAGAGARAFAAKMGIPYASLLQLSTPRTLRMFRERRADTPTKGTCGAVALDRDGNIAAATSTGGTPNKMAGRVGDSPLVGSGAYADNQSGGASATGEGEQIMRVVLSKTATDAIAQGMDAQAAADHAIKTLVTRVNGKGGIIVVDHNGGVGFAHSEPNIAVGWVADGQVHGAIRRG